MKINEREVTVFLDQEGQSVMGLLAVDVQIPVYVEETDDMGIWARIDRADGEHTVLIRWDYVLAVDFPSMVKRVGFPR